jgi:hypothetical protein
MPRATVNVEETEHVELKSLPGGYVTLRRLSYGQLLHRRAMASSMRMEAQGKNFAAEMQMVNESVTVYEFANCIIEHNLEDENGKTLNFKNAADIRRLDPRIGEEIDQHISKLNNFEEDGEAEAGNSSSELEQ